MIDSVGDVVPVNRDEIKSIAGNYQKVTIGVLGSHSAEEVGMAAKSAGLKTVVICQKGRESLYADYSRHLFDHVIVLNHFKDILEVQDQLRELNTVFLPNRSFSVYVGYDNIEDKFLVPIYGNRFMLRIEERTVQRNQYWLLEKAGIRTPKEFINPDEIDRLVVVKLQRKEESVERAFFYPSSPEEYYAQADELLDSDFIRKEDLATARIEEFIIGPRFHANFVAYTLLPGFDFVGFEDRVQSNISGILALPAKEQLKIDVPVIIEPIGHFGLTMRESKKPLIYEAGRRFIEASKKHFPPGIIGPFSLQGAIPQPPDFVVFDVSPRIPGSPCVGPSSPEMHRLSLKYNLEIHSPLELCMMEIKHALKQSKLAEVVT